MDINYRPLVIDRLLELSKISDDLTFGELLHSILIKSRLKVRKKSDEDGEDVKFLNKLKTVKDEDFLSSIEIAIEIEKEHSQLKLTNKDE